MYWSQPELIRERISACRDIVFPHAQYLKSRPRTTVPGCVPRGSPSVRPAAPVTADSIGAAAG